MSYCGACRETHIPQLRWSELQQNVRKIGSHESLTFTALRFTLSGYRRGLLNTRTFEYARKMVVTELSKAVSYDVCTRKRRCRVKPDWPVHTTACGHTLFVVYLTCRY